MWVSSADCGDTCNTSFKALESLLRFEGGGAEKSLVLTGISFSLIHLLQKWESCTHQPPLLPGALHNPSILPIVYALNVLLRHILE